MLCLQWNDFQENLISAFVNLREDYDFAGVTLVSEDGQQFEAHKVILAASDPFFQKLFGRNKQTHSAEQDVGGSGNDNCEECVEENFNCLRIPPFVVEERLPMCETWEEFLEGQKEGLVLVVSREKKDLSEASFGPRGSRREDDLNDNVVLGDSPSDKLPID